VFVYSFFVVTLMIDSVGTVERPGLELGSSENLYVFQGLQVVMHLAEQLLMHMKHMENKTVAA
jgi:hypothetical protein